MVDNYTKVGTQTPMMKFSAKLAEVVQKYVRLHKPYDEQCARLDFKDYCDTIERESERTNGYVKYEELKINVDTFDFDKYGKDDRFELIEDQQNFIDNAEKKNLAVGIKVDIVSGHTISYRCKNRGHGIAVFIPIDEYEARHEKKAPSK